MSIPVNSLISSTFEAGKIARTHGVGGGLILRLEQAVEEVEDFPEWIFLRREGGLVPYRIVEESVYQKDPSHLVIRIEGVTTQESAARLAGSACNLEGQWSDWFRISRKEEISYIGYEIRDEISGENGAVIGFEDIPGNPLLEIRMEGQTALLPLQSDFILEIDDLNRILTVRLPSDLMEL